MLNFIKMKIIKGFFTISVIVLGVFFISTSVNTEKENEDLSSLLAIETAEAKMVFFGCGSGGTWCGGIDNCKSVIFSSHRCAGWERGVE